MKFHGEKVPLSSGGVAWVVVDTLYRLHVEACTYLESLRGRRCSPNTQRNYASRVALYLTWCDERGLDWRDPGFENLVRFADWLVSTPLPSRGRKRSSKVRFRLPGSVDQVLGTMTEFLGFGVRYGWVSTELVLSLVHPKQLRFLPEGFSAGEGGRFREIRTRTLKLRGDDPGLEFFTAEQVELMIHLARNARDKFLIALMWETGMRIGETLGLRREDLHLLPDSRSLGCFHHGPHVHVRRRADNDNGALAKSHTSRVIPVEDALIGYYRDYQWERERVPAATECDLVFVNLFRSPLGKAMSYSNAKQLFDRLAKWAEIIARPHMLRHTAATQWLEAGVSEDVVSGLLGHASPQSMKPYKHVTDRRKREAVERVAAARR